MQLELDLIMVLAYKQLYVVPARLQSRNDFVCEVGIIAAERKSARLFTRLERGRKKCFFYWVSYRADYR